MADQKITDLATQDATDLADDDQLVIVDVSDGTMAPSGTTKKLPVASLRPRDEDMKAHGAIGDDSADDATAMQAAIDAAETAGAGVFVPPGTYKYSVTPTISAARTRLHGIHGKSILKPGAAIPALEIIGTSGSRASDCLVERLVIDGRDSGGTPIATSGIRMGFAEESTLRDVIAEYCNGPGIFGDNAVGTINQVKLLNCTSRFNKGAGFEARGAPNNNNIEIQNGLYANNETYGLDIEGTSNRVHLAWIPNNWLFGVRLSTSVGAVFVNTLIENNYKSLLTWATGVAKVVGDRVRPTNTTTNPYTFQCTTAGTTDATTEPVWSGATTPGSTIVDGTVTWTNVGSNLNGGAGIDDTGAFRCVYWRENTNNQPLLGLGDCVDINVRSDLGGGAFEMLFGRNALGPQNGIAFAGAATSAYLLARGIAANIDLGFRPKGTGGLALGTGTQKIKWGTGDPNSVHVAGIGSLFLRFDGGAGTSLYVKESGTGNTGWVAK